MVSNHYPQLYLYLTHKNEGSCRKLRLSPIIKSHIKLFFNHILDPKARPMFGVEVRDSIMIAHSFKGDVFGPAQALHGATFVVDACIIAKTLDKNNIVVDIGCFMDVLKAILKPLNYTNLDDNTEFKGQNTTTEFLTHHIHSELSKAARENKLGRAPKELHSIKITISESHAARAWYEAEID
jgi:6-pyruvoyl-tetrahydropterin synthase